MSGCVLDTDVIIAAMDRADLHHERAARAMRRWHEGRVPLLVSTINYAEALVRPAAHEETLSQAVAAISTLGIVVLAPSPATARQAARWRGLGVSLADGFAMASAQERGARLATFDHRVRRALDAAGLALAEEVAPT